MTSTTPRRSARTRKSADLENTKSERRSKLQKRGPAGSQDGDIRRNAPASSHAGDLSIADRILVAERHLSDRLSEEVRFGHPVTHVYDPYQYAWDAHEWYTRTYGNTQKEILLVGMNPGPWGMAQTGVPFGQVAAVRDYLQLPSSVAIGRPAREHPKRPVSGLQCERAEVSGDRLWNQWARSKHGEDAEEFFKTHFVYSYCPLLFLEASGRNRPASALRAGERRAMEERCDDGLRAVVRALGPRLVVGVGVWAAERARKALGDEGGVMVRTLPHPSPASPAANRGWAETAGRKMEEFVAELGDGGDGGCGEAQKGKKAGT